MGLVSEHASGGWDTEAEYHRGQRDRFAGQYDPPAPSLPGAGALGVTVDDGLDAAREAYENGYRQGEITP